MKDHCAAICADLGVREMDYTIKPFMCVNKVFVSRYKEIAFPIVSYREMVALLDMLLDVEKDGDYYTSVGSSVGITMNGKKAESVLFGIKDYYNL
jgi:hypothetical protein